MDEVEEYVRTRAQFIADHIDATISIAWSRGVLISAVPTAEVDVFLRDVGWQGRKYPLSYFSAATIPDPVRRAMERHPHL